MPIIPNINNEALQLLPDIALWKQQIADAINYKGGTSEPTQAFTELAEEIKDIPNFPTTGFEFIGETPKNLMEAYALRSNITSIYSEIKEINENSIFYGSSSLITVDFPKLEILISSNCFRECSSLVSLNVPNLRSLQGSNIFLGCSLFKRLNAPALEEIGGSDLFTNGFKELNCPNLTRANSLNTFANTMVNIILGTLTLLRSRFITDNQTSLRNITIGQNTNINLTFEGWKGTNVIAEGQSGIDELNNNLYNNLLTKLYDHSNDGETRILQIGWLDYITAENIAYANAKGWTITN